MKLRPEQAKFREDHSGIGVISTLGIIIEQCSEYQSPVYLPMVELESPLNQ